MKDIINYNGTTYESLGLVTGDRIPLGAHWVSFDNELSPSVCVGQRVNVNDSGRYYKPVTDIHEYDGRLWRKLKYGEIIRRGDRYENQVTGKWCTQGQQPNCSDGRMYSRSYHPHYRDVGPAPTKPKEMVTITYQVTKEYAEAQARETRGRNDNLTARFAACREAVGDPRRDALKEELKRASEEANRVQQRAIIAARRRDELEDRLQSLR